MIMFLTINLLQIYICKITNFFSFREQSVKIYLLKFDKGKIEKINKERINKKNIACLI